MIRALTGVMSEFSVNKRIADLVPQGLLSECQHIDPAVSPLLTEQFQFGLAGVIGRNAMRLA